MKGVVIKNDIPVVDKVNIYLKRKNKIEKNDCAMLVKNPNLKITSPNNLSNDLTKC